MSLEAFAAAWAAGRALSLDQVISAAREVTGSPVDETESSAGASDGKIVLTRREREVLRLLARGMTDREIADALFISHRTVNAHVASILGKLGVSTRREAATLSRDVSTRHASPETASPDAH
jgi:DNA-binding NarL/FixJ family response regulator